MSPLRTAYGEALRLAELERLEAAQSDLTDLAWAYRARGMYREEAQVRRHIASRDERIAHLRSVAP